MFPNESPALKYLIKLSPPKKSSAGRVFCFFFLAHQDHSCRKAKMPLAMWNVSWLRRPPWQPDVPSRHQSTSRLELRCCNEDVLCMGKRFQSEELLKHGHMAARLREPKIRQKQHVAAPVLVRTHPQTPRSTYVLAFQLQLECAGKCRICYINMQ